MKRRAKASSVLPTTSTGSREKTERRRRRSKKRDYGLIQRLCLGVTALGLSLFLLRQLASLSSGPETTDLYAIRQAPAYSTGMSDAYQCPEGHVLSREILDKSLGLGSQFLMNHQREAGNFDYEYDWKTDYNSKEDSEVRQAGALWGLALIFHDMMIHAESEGVLSGSGKNVQQKRSALKTTASKLLHGIDFFRQHSKVIERENDDDEAEEAPYPSQMRYVTYPGGDVHDQGAQALTCLALIDFLRAIGSRKDAEAIGLHAVQIDDVRTMLDEMLPFLVTQHSGFGDERFEEWDEIVENGRQMLETGSWFGEAEGESDLVAWWLELQNMNGQFMGRFNERGKRKETYSPYYDGESLLAVIKAAKYLGPEYVHLWPFATGAARTLHQVHVVEALEEDRDSDTTKGVYQWLSMSLFELASVSFGDGYSEPFNVPAAVETTFHADQFGRWLVDLALWMIDVHKTLEMGRNTGYAYEGIVSAYSWASNAAEQNNDEDLALITRKLECTMEKGLSKLIGWQVGMGAENHKKNGKNWDGVKGLGGIQNSKNDTPLRIDVTQHQMHATILARRLAYANPNAEWPWDSIAVSES